MKKGVIVIASLLLFSCSKDKEVEKKTAIAEKGFFTKCKDFFVEPNEMKVIRRETYLKDMSSKYTEYKNVLEFFSRKNNPFVLEENGSVYKIIDSQIDDAGSKLYNYEDENLLKYFYVTDNNYYIYSFSHTNKSDLLFQSLRRIEKGFFKTEVHDLVFENGKLIRENFIGKYATDFFDKDGIQKFEFSNKVNGDKVINTFNLGNVKDF